MAYAQFYGYPDEVYTYVDKLNILFREMDASRNFQVRGIPSRPTSTRELDKFDLPVDINISHPELKVPYVFSTSLVFYSGDSIQEEVTELESELEERVNTGLPEQSNPKIKFQLDRRHLD